MRGGVLLRDGLVERVDRDHVQDRREGFGLHDRPVVARADDGRLDEVARPLERPCRRTSSSPPAALRRCDRRLVALDRRAIDQRAHQRAGSSGSPMRHLRVGVHQAPLQLGRDRAECTNTRRVVVQRWPAVPTAPNTMAGTARSRFAVSSTMMALLPPSSSRLLPRRAATRSPTLRPTAVEPVKETSATRRSSTKRVRELGARSR